MERQREMNVEVKGLKVQRSYRTLNVVNGKISIAVYIHQVPEFILARVLSARLRNFNRHNLRYSPTHRT